MSCSRNGNPAFDVTLDDGATYRTSADVGLAYGIQNPEYRENAHEFELTRPTRNSPMGRLTGYCRKVEGTSYKW